MTEETSWKSIKTDKRYNLGSIWLLITLKEKSSTISVREYFNETQKLKLEKVEKLDEEDILDYFQGRTEVSECINADLKQKII